MRRVAASGMWIAIGVVAASISTPTGSPIARLYAQSTTNVTPTLPAPSSSPAAPSPAPAAPALPGSVAPSSPGSADASPASPDDLYRIGPDDVLTIAVLQAPEINTSARVSQQGAITLPLAGVVNVGGLTTREVEEAVGAILKQKYIRDPQVTVQVTEMQSHAVSVVGAVAKPGVFQIRGTKRLLEILSLAGGLAPDAGDLATVTRGADDTSVDVHLKALLASSDASANLPVRPGDVVKVQHAAIVYVVGEIKKPGAFPMPNNEKLTVLRALALGEGLEPTAAKDDAIILRTDQQGAHTEIPVRLSRVLKAADPDVVLQAQDVLFVPASGGKAFARGTLDALTRVLTLRTPIP